MTVSPDPLHNPAQHPARLAADLLHHYSFELAGYFVVEQIEIWLAYFPVEWLPLAIIEALYQGRYKAISVEQILNLWQRRGQPVYHFNREFERLICGNLPNSRSTLSQPYAKSTIAPFPQPSLSYRKLLMDLPSVQAVSRLERLSEIPSLRLKTTLSPVSPSSVALPETSIAPNPDGVASPVAPVKSDQEFQNFKEAIIFGLSSGLAVQSLHPRLRLQLSQWYKPNWLAFVQETTTIIPFGSKAEE